MHLRLQLIEQATDAISCVIILQLFLSIVFLPVLLYLYYKNVVLILRLAHSLYFAQKRRFQDFNLGVTDRPTDQWTDGHTPLLRWETPLKMCHRV